MVTYGDLDNFKAVSANKKDVEVTMRAIDVLHKQLEALCHLVTMKLKAGLEKDQKCESKHTKANLKVQQFGQALYIYRWIQQFDLRNDCFDQKPA